MLLYCGNDWGLLTFGGGVRGRWSKNFRGVFIANYRVEGSREFAEAILGLWDPAKSEKGQKIQLFFFDFFWHFFGFFEGFFDFGLNPGWVNSANTPVTRGVAPLRQYSGHLMTFILGQNSYIFKKDTALCQKSRVRSHLWDPGLHWALQRPLFYPPVV